MHVWYSDSPLRALLKGEYLERREARESCSSSFVEIDSETAASFAPKTLCSIYF